MIVSSFDDEMNSLPKTMGAEGAQALNDIENYVDGINALSHPNFDSELFQMPFGGV